MVQQSVTSRQPIKDNFSRNWASYWMSSAGELGMADRFFNCGEGGRGWVGVCPDGHQVYHAFGCESRVCGRCAARRSKAMYEGLIPAVQKLVVAAPGRLGLRHITLGTDISLLEYAKVYGDGNGSPGRLSGAGLSGMREIIKLYRGFVVDMLRNLLGHDKQCGWAIGVEFGMKGLMLHFHVLALSPYIAQRELAALWEGVSLGRGHYTFIKAVPRDPISVARAVKYVCKYVTKPLGTVNSDEGSPGTSDNSLRVQKFVLDHGIECVIAALAVTFKGVRRFQEYGSFYAMERAVEPPECCEVCGQKLHWLSEMAFLESPVWSGLLNSSKTNNFVDGGGGGEASPPVNEQILLF